MGNGYGYTTFPATMGIVPTISISVTAGAATDVNARVDGFYATYSALNSFTWSATADL